MTTEFRLDENDLKEAVNLWPLSGPTIYATAFFEVKAHD
jgi:hypothetical protein